MNELIAVKTNCVNWRRPRGQVTVCRLICPQSWVLGAEGGCSAPWKWGYNIRRVFETARKVTNLSETAPQAVFKVSPDSTTHKIERFNKGAWEVSHHSYLPAGPVCSRCGCLDSNCMKSLLVTIYMWSWPFRWVQKRKRKKKKRDCSASLHYDVIKATDPLSTPNCDCLMCPLLRNVSHYFCAFRYFIDIFLSRMLKENRLAVWKGQRRIHGAATRDTTEGRPAQLQLPRMNVW